MKSLFKREEEFLSSCPPWVVKQARKAVWDRTAERVKYDVVQSDLETFEIKYRNDSLTKKAENTEELLLRLAKAMLQGTYFLRLLGEVAEDLYLMGNTAWLMSILSWPVLDEELQIFNDSYRGRRDGRHGKPEYRLVRNRLRIQVRGIEPEDASGTSVASYNVLRDYNGEPSGFWPKDDPCDIIYEYAHLIVRVMWRLYNARHAEVEWLRNPGVIDTVDKQVYLLYNVLLYKQFEEKERLVMQARRLGEPP